MVDGGAVVEEEEKMRFCNVGRRRCLVLAWRLAVKPAVAATAFLIASPWQRFPNNLSSAASSSGSIGARPLKLGTGPAQYRCSRPLLSPAGQDRASIFGEQRFIICQPCVQASLCFRLDLLCRRYRV